MARKGVQSEQWRAALEKVHQFIKTDLLNPDVADGTAYDETYMDAGVYFRKKFPSQESKDAFHVNLQQWLASLGADVENAIKVVGFAWLSSLVHFASRSEVQDTRRFRCKTRSIFHTHEGSRDGFPHLSSGSLCVKQNVDVLPAKCFVNQGAT